LRKFFEPGLLLTYKKDEQICGGDNGPCNYIHYIKTGLVKAYTETDKEHVHVVLTTDEIFPVLKVIDSQDRRVRYATVTRAKIYNIHKDVVIKKLQTDHKYSNDFLAATLHLYRIQADRVDNLEYREAYQRVVNRILFLLARFGTKQTDGSYLLDACFTHKLIGNTLNLSRESVSREIMQLQERNLVQRSDGGMLIPNVNKLAAELKWPLSASIWGLGE